MSNLTNMDMLAQATSSILCPPFEWCPVKGGTIVLEDASPDGGTTGGVYHVTDFALAHYPITNAQYSRFLEHPNGFANPCWWAYSAQASQWRLDHPHPKPTAFPGPDLPRTRVSWFDSMAFCHWLSAELVSKISEWHLKSPDPQNVTTWCVRLPTEQEWQRAALGDTGWRYPWGDELDETRGNYAKHVGRPTRVGQYPAGQSPFQVLDMIGNVWEWCLTGWGTEQIDVSGYTYRAFKGGAWNVSNPDHLAANGRGGHPPRGRLNDCGFRCRYRG